MPSYDLLITTQAEKQVKKLPISVKKKLKSEFDCIQSSPTTAGKPLKGKIMGTKVHSRRFHLQGVSYRIAYSIQTPQQNVVILKVGTRENFYKSLK